MHHIFQHTTDVIQNSETVHESSCKLYNLGFEISDPSKLSTYLWEGDQLTHNFGLKVQGIGPSVLFIFLMLVYFH